MKTLRHRVNVGVFGLCYNAARIADDFHTLRLKVGI